MICKEEDEDEDDEDGEECGAVLGYVIGLCTGNPSLDDGACYNPDADCPGFLPHCRECGDHYYKDYYNDRDLSARHSTCDKCRQ